jgi:hypothetical protein
MNGPFIAAESGDGWTIHTACRSIWLTSSGHRGGEKRWPIRCMRTKRPFCASCRTEVSKQRACGPLPLRRASRWARYSTTSPRRLRCCGLPWTTATACWPRGSRGSSQNVRSQPRARRSGCAARCCCQLMRTEGQAPGSGQPSSPTAAWTVRPACWHQMPTRACSPFRQGDLSSVAWQRDRAGRRATGGHASHERDRGIAVAAAVRDLHGRRGTGCARHPARSDLRGRSWLSRSGRWRSSEA